MARLHAIQGRLDAAGVLQALHFRSTEAGRLCCSRFARLHNGCRAWSNEFGARLLAELQRACVTGSVCSPLRPHQ